jgi:hypothetical protein
MRDTCRQGRRADAELTRKVTQCKELKMKRIRLMVLATMAVVAGTALAASAASAALPEFLPSGTKSTFTSTSGPGTLETAAKEKIECTADTNEGSITGAKTVKVTIRFTGCKAFGFANCKTTGAKEGELVVVAPTGTLGYIKKAAPTQVGLSLAITEFSFECLGGLAKGKVRGGVIGEVTPINTETTTGKLILKQKEGKQEFTKFEGGAETKLESSKNGGAFEAAGEETTDTITFKEKIKIDG